MYLASKNTQHLKQMETLSLTKIFNQWLLSFILASQKNRWLELAGQHITHTVNITTKFKKKRNKQTDFQCLTLKFLDTGHWASKDNKSLAPKGQATSPKQGQKKVHLQKARELGTINWSHEKLQDGPPMVVLNQLVPFEWHGSKDLVSTFAKMGSVSRGDHVCNCCNNYGFDCKSSGLYYSSY